jgi:hypothetical protein
LGKGDDHDDDDDGMSKSGKGEGKGGSGKGDDDDGKGKGGSGKGRMMMMMASGDNDDGKGKYGKGKGGSVGSTSSSLNLVMRSRSLTNMEAHSSFVPAECHHVHTDLFDTSNGSDTTKSIDTSNSSDTNESVGDSQPCTVDWYALQEHLFVSFFADHHGALVKRGILLLDLLHQCSFHLLLSWVNPFESWGRMGLTASKEKANNAACLNFHHLHAM